jgi:putative intracellular protease/amidase
MAKVLVYVSSATSVPIKEGGTSEAGIFLGELTEPLMPFHEKGHELIFITPDGCAPTIDKNSYNLMNWNFSKKRLNKSIEFLKTMNGLGLKSPLKANAVIADEQLLNSFDGIFIPGGHAPMNDIVFNDWAKSNDLNQETGKLLCHFHDNNKPTAAICHGVAALAAAPEVDGKWLYDGYCMTCVTMLVEWLAEDMPLLKTMKGHMSDYPTPILERKGAILKQQKIPLLSQVVEDRELLTGQDPFSAKELGQKFVNKVEDYTKKK